MRSNLRVAIATAGRFHVFDLARELHALGHDVTLYSYVPHQRARQFGIGDEYYVNLLPFVAPALIWQRIARYWLPQAAEWFSYKSLNWAVRLRLRPCDVFVCMSGIYLEAARYAKRKFDAKIWLERGSQHILSQDEILRQIPGVERPSARTIKRELEGYELADRIVIPSKHVEDSFRRDPRAFAKVFRNPLGVDLDAFPLRERKDARAPFTLLFVGNWSLRKGCDLLTKAVMSLPDVQLLHVGAVSDAGFPADDKRFVHVDAVSQVELPQFYTRAAALVLPSREDGFGMVMAQALASGLPIICTDRTGGPDLAYTPAFAERITIVPSGDVAALATAIGTLKERLRKDNLAPLIPSDRELLSWTSYARRYSDELRRKFG